MGGWAIKETGNLPESEKFLSSDIDEFWFLDHSGARFLLKDVSIRSQLPNLTEEEIKSKSKASGLAKTIICLQASWFIAQCLSHRK